MRIKVALRDGSERIFDNVQDVKIMEPGMAIPPGPEPGRLVLSAAALVAWMVVTPDESVDKPDLSQSVELVE